MSTIPQCEIAVIGGSSTFSIQFPGELPAFQGKILEDNLVIDTPYGESPPFVIFTLDKETEENKIITCKMHGWRSGVDRGNASRQIFWVFREVGVKKIIAEGGVGAINHLLNPRDIIIPHDYIDFSLRKDVSLGSDFLLIMREALCPHIRKVFFEAAGKLSSRKIFERGIYVNTDGRHFESPAEINMFSQLKADIVGQSICPEVYLSREIGACYAGLYMVVNYAEGVVKDWEHEELKEIFYNEAHAIGEIMLEALSQLIKGKRAQKVCHCLQLRKNTLLT